MIEPPEVPHTHHAGHEAPARHPALRLFFDAVTPISVLLLSIGSLFVALHTGTAMDKLVAHNEKLVKAQSTPILEFNTSNSKDDKLSESSWVLSFDLLNVGTGPAKLNWVRIAHGGQHHPNFPAWVQSLREPGAKPFDAPLSISTSPLTRVVLPAGGIRPAFSWPRPKEDGAPERSLWKRADTERFKMRVEVCYCSVFDECWEASLPHGDHKPVAQCTAPGKAEGALIDR